MLLDEKKGRILVYMRLTRTICARSSETVDESSVQVYPVCNNCACDQNARCGYGSNGDGLDKALHCSCPTREVIVVGI